LAAPDDGDCASTGLAKAIAAVKAA